ncbi:carboxypeptidase B precursor [Pyrenophora tritici-repentis Pt-1C-BFP]|uniref:Carboxypeptidase B n=1 Tax=Pyrenophora tritici-repentis (strain Pt-1C-BFP) TaxID=426418 RepID=B2W6I7_PYRTR|nr:carboxypeptidase B precursor [Pyrenophora tritici-repentis Pt-1C-BFP]EDU48345.1 carboxypeptidase B precursor [Pyrenophora tritici-repentis Pt-1C-BFP]
MKTTILTSALLLSSTALGTVVPRAGKKVDYNGYKVLRVTSTNDMLAQIESLAAHVLNPGKSAEMDVVVAPENVDALTALVTESKTLNEDVGAALAEEGEMGIYAVPSESWFTAYHPYADHLQFLRDLQAGYTSQSEIVTVGTSVQGRVLTGIHIWGSGGKGSKPAVIIHGNVHAREWITSMTTDDATIKSLVDKFDFYITPIVNPDGFVYSQTTDRLWRKNRQTVSGNSCVGRDINRNWPYKWEVAGGASTNPCSETYKGVAAGDSPELRGVKAQVDALKASRGIRLYLDVHSYGQYILWPYGYDCSLRPENDAQHRSLASRAQSAISAVSGTPYTIGPSCSTLYATTGSSTDYTDVQGNATYSYTYELRDKGTYGFVLPANQIRPTVLETWAGVASMLKDA